MSEMSLIHSDCSTARLMGKLMFLWEVIYVIPDPMQNGWLLTTIIQLYIKWNEHKTRQTTQHHHANVTLSPVNLAEFFLWIFCWDCCFTGSWAKALLVHNCRNVRDKQYSRLLYLYPRLALTHQCVGDVLYGKEGVAYETLTSWGCLELWSWLKELLLSINWAGVPWNDHFRKYHFMNK